MARLLLALPLLLAAAPAQGCGRPVCQVDPAALSLASRISFDDLPAGYGPGIEIPGVLLQPGAAFGERFAGQVADGQTGHDRIVGIALAPLVVEAGAPGRNLAVLRLGETNVLTGSGPAGFPRTQATGEGAIALLFARDQGALRLTVAGGEGGGMRIVFLARDGREIDTHLLEGLGAGRIAFRRQGQAEDIAGLLITNDDPEGIALDAVEFDGADRIGAAPTAAELPG